MNNSEFSSKVKLNQKLYIGLAIAGTNTLNGLVTGALMKFYTDIIHMDPQLYGFIYLFYTIWNAINDPIFGYLSDKRPLEKGVGKRLPWMRRAIPLYIIGFYFLWLANPSWDDIIAFLYLLGILYLYDSAFTIYVLNHCALATGITNDPNERASISMIINYMSVIPGIIAFIPPLLLTGGFNQLQIVIIFSLIGLFGLVLLLIGTYKIKEPEFLFKDEQPLGLKKSFKNTFQSKSFVYFVIYSFMLAGVGISFPSLNLYYLQWIMGLSQLDAVIPIMIGGAIILALFPVFFLLNKKIGVRNTLLINIIIGIFGYLGLLLMPPKAIVLFVIFYSCALLNNSIHFMFANTIIGDIADEDELKTGERREGMFFGMNALIAFPSVGIIIFIFTTLLKITNYDNSEGAITQPIEVQIGIRIGVGLIQVIFLIIAFIMMYLYPLHGKKYKELKNEIQIYQEKKKS